MVESTYQMFREASLLNQRDAGHKELLFPDSSFQGAEDSKALYDLVEAKMANFQKDYFGLHRLHEVSYFLDEVKLFGSSVALVGQIAELARQIKEKNQDAY